METKDRNRPRRKVSAPSRPQKAGTQIIYTPAKPFNRNRFLLHLATVAAVVLALVFGMSIFFKARQVTVSGAEKYTAWEIRQAAGIGDGEALLSLSEAKITARIRTALPYVGDVRVGIKLPDTVMIEITELEVVYAVEDSNSAWWLMDATGRIVDSTDAADAKNYTRIDGVKIQNAAIGQQAAAYEPESEESSQTVESEAVPTVPTVAVTPARQLLAAAVRVLTALEQNGVMGNVVSVDVSEVSELKLWYEDRYQVSLGDTGKLDYKIAAMKAAIEKMGEYQSGYLDVSFTIWPNEVGFQPFEDNSGTKN